MDDHERRVHDHAIPPHLPADCARYFVYRYRLAPSRGFEYVSPSVTWLTGYTPEEHYADPDLCFKLVHPDDHDTLEQMLAGRLTEPAILRFVRQDGRIIWMEQRSRALVDGAGQLAGLEGIAYDITERRQAEEALAAEARLPCTRTEVAAEIQRLEERFRVVTESINDALYTIDLDGHVTFGNSALERLTGYRIAELLGRSTAVFYAAGSDAILRGRRKRAPRRKAVRSYGEIEVLSKDGRRIPAELSGADLVQQGKVVGYVGVLRDLTERKRAAEEAGRRRREAEVLAHLARTLNASLDPQEVGQRIVESLRGLFGTVSAALLRLEMPAGDVTVLAESGEVDAAIGKHSRLVGRTGIIGLAVRKRQPVASADFLAARRLSPKAAPGSVPEGRLHRSVLALPLIQQERVIGALAILDRPGRLFTAEEIRLAQAFADQAATALENAQLYQELQRAYDKLSHTQDQLIHAQKMEAVGRLAGGIAHDFNNLLTVIMGRADLVLSRLRGRDRLRRHLELILSAADSAASLTRQLLAFSRRQVLLPEVIDLNAVVVNVSMMLRWLIGEDIAVSIRLAPGLGRIKADPGQLEQVLMNLAVNARDAMPQGGQLTIETANVELDDAYAQSHLGVQAGRYVRLTMQDSGCGMDAETQARIFEPFFTTKEPGKGTGLGLSTVYGIITQSGGHISVDSAPGKGTTFTIDLPRSEDPLTTEMTDLPPSGLPRGTETILLVEDEETVRSVAREVLQMAGYTVLEAATGEEALQQSPRHGGPIHLLVTDVVMPGMNGRELAERLTVDDAALRVLYLSGYTDEAIARHGVLEAGIELLPKPFTPETLARRVREVLDRQAPE